MSDERALGFFERYLSLWVALAIGVGAALGVWVPRVFEVISRWQIGGVNLVIAALIWAMIFPMMLKVELSSLRQAGRRPKGLVLTVVINWLIKPLTMFGLGWLAFRVVFAGLVEEGVARQAMAGMILLGVAPCTAMVFVWSHLTRGDPAYTLAQVSLNDVILLFAFAPLTGALLGVGQIQVPWLTLWVSVLLFVVLPLGLGVFVRAKLIGRGGAAAVDDLARRLKPLGMFGLLLTVVLLFGFQAPTLLARPGLVMMIALPLLLQSYGIFALGYGLARALKLPHQIAAPAALIGTSNFFELAVAVAIGLFGLESVAALATVVGVLIEVPVMLSLVAFANKTNHWFKRAERV